MKPINLTVPWLPEWIDAVTLWPFIVYCLGCEDSISLRRHEYYHWRQATRWGVVPWYLAYVILLPFYWKRPREHPMEVEAYKVQWATEMAPGKSPRTTLPRGTVKPSKPAPRVDQMRRRNK